VKIRDDVSARVPDVTRAGTDGYFHVRGEYVSFFSEGVDVDDAWCDSFEDGDAALFGGVCAKDSGWRRFLYDGCIDLFGGCC